MSTALREIDDDVWVSDYPELRFLGIKLGSRMTIVRLPAGELWVYSPVPLTKQLRDEVDDLGEVRHIVAPNLYHHLYAGHWAEAYPHAKLFGVKGLGKKRPDLVIASEFDDESHPGWEGLTPLSIHGTMLGETVFLHEPSRSLIACDLVENFHECDNFFTKAYLKVGGIYQKPGVHRVLRLAFRKRDVARQCIDRLLEWDFDRVIVAHGSVVESDAKDTVRSTYAWL